MTDITDLADTRVRLTERGWSRGHVPAVSLVEEWHGEHEGRRLGIVLPRRMLTEVDAARLRVAREVLRAWGVL